VSTPLRCPHCGAEIDFAAWRETASCASCGERVRFEAAAAAGAEAGESPQPAPARTLFGKPLHFTAAWAAVFLIWAGAAGGLAALRLDMGHLTVLSPRERAAIVDVRGAELEGGVVNGEALAMVLARFGAVYGTAPKWHVQDRPWEGKVYVTWELGADLRLGWTAAYDGTVVPGAETSLFLKEVVRAGQPQSAPALPLGLSSSSRSSSGGANPRRIVFSVVTRGSRNCST
jgi:hypothetical protein